MCRLKTKPSGDSGIRIRDHVKVAFVAFPGEQAAESGLHDGNCSEPGLRYCFVILDKVIDSSLSLSPHEATKLDQLPWAHLC